MIEIPERVLVIVAHQDDETIGCGGSLAKWADRGSEIEVVFVTDGKTGIDQRDLYDSDSIISIRMKEAKKAAEILGLKDVSTFNQDCQKVDGNSQVFFHAMIAKIRDFRPNLILTHSPQDKHRDHRATSALVIEAAWKANENIHSSLGLQHRVDDVWGMEILDMHESPDFIVELNPEFLDKKLMATDIYKSQEKVVESIKNSIKGLSLVRGYAVGCKYGEAFKRLSKVPVVL